MTQSRSTRAVDALLAEHGFRRYGSTWVRERGLFADVVDVQRGRSVEGVTVNLALMHAQTSELTWGKPLAFPPTEPHCVVRTRLGFLLDRRDRWWRQDDMSSIAEMTDALASAGLPFFDAFQDLGEIERWLDASPANLYPPEALYLVAVKYQRGKASEARDIPKKLRERTTSQPWRERIAEVAEALG